MLASRRIDRQRWPVPEQKFTRQVENMIAEMRGLPGDESSSRRRETRAIGDLTDHLLRKHRIGMKTPEEAIRDAWAEIVGAPNAEYCHPQRIDRERVLIVGVTNPIVRQELMFHKGIVLQRVQAIPACHQIKDVAFRSG